MNNQDVYEYWCDDNETVATTARHFDIAQRDVEAILNEFLGE